MKDRADLCNKIADSFGYQISENWKDVLIDAKLSARMEAALMPVSPSAKRSNSSGEQYKGKIDED
jgi:hypothetical protein